MSIAAIPERHRAAPPRTAHPLRTMLQSGALDLPVPGAGATAQRWERLLDWGRADLPLARLAEGHTDALAILREAGARPVPDALYGVWAARSGGTGAELGDGPGAGTLRGTVRFCSGAHLLDRALVVAATPGGSRVTDLDLSASGVRPVDDSWQAPGMRDSDTVDVELADVAVDERDLRGAPGWYTDRLGFWWGGAGVAAVWLGGALGVLDALRAGLAPQSGHGVEQSRLAHLGALHASVSASRALLDATAAPIDADPTSPHRTAVWTLRSAVERTCRDVLEVTPRAAGGAALTRSPLGQQLADLGIYVRQHHGERDLAALGQSVLGESVLGESDLGDAR
jgi:alkylation response protein AidB-like acyl-CoA dehydrogenase